MENPYKPCDCGVDCDLHEADENEPCWGSVCAVDEIQFEDDYQWVHACQGHETYSTGGKYVPAPPGLQAPPTREERTRHG